MIWVCDQPCYMSFATLKKLTYFVISTQLKYACQIACMFAHLWRKRLLILTQPSNEP